MMRLNQQSWIDDGQLPIPWALVAGMFVAFVLMMIRVATINSPLMGSDEYAYFQAAHFHDVGTQIYSLDPYLQQVDNKIYPWLYKLWSMVSVEHAATVGRLFNALAYCLGAMLLYGIFVRVSDRKSATIASLLYLAMPFSFYATTLLPEVEFQLFVYLLTFIWVVARPPYGIGVLLLGAFASAIGYLIKPHAVAAILASTAYLFWVGTTWSHGGLTRRAWTGLWRAFVYIVSTVVLIKVLRHVLDPSGTGAVVAGFYQQYLIRLLDLHYLPENIASVGKYFLGHLWAWAIFFTPGIFLLISDSRHGVALIMRRSGQDAVAMSSAETPYDRRLRLSLFITLLACAMLLMVSAFTSAAALGSAAEDNRLHGRYIEALLPFLLVSTLWATVGTRRVLASVAALAALISFLWWGRTLFHLYPWDYPDIFGFFSPVAGQWTFNGALLWPVWVTVAAGLAFWSRYLTGRGRQWSYALFFLACMIAAQAQVSAWLGAESDDTRQTLVDGRAIRTYIGAPDMGSGLVVVNDRFGSGAYLLAALDSPQYVRMVAKGATLTASAIPTGVSWVVAPRSMDVRLPTAAVLRFGGESLYLMDEKYQWPEVPPKPPWHGAAIAIDTSLSGQRAVLHGFNEPEAWGSWSSTRDAYIELPAMVSGRVQLNFFGWVADATSHPRVQIRLGNVTRELDMGGTGKDYEVVMDVTEPADRLYVESTPVSPDGGPRELGVAMARVRLTAVPASIESAATSH